MALRIGLAAILLISVTSNWLYVFRGADAVLKRRVVCYSPFLNLVLAALLLESFGIFDAQNAVLFLLFFSIVILWKLSRISWCHTCGFPLARGGLFSEYLSRRYLTHCPSCKTPWNVE